MGSAATIYLVVGYLYAVVRLDDDFRSPSTPEYQRQLWVMLILVPIVTLAWGAIFFVNATEPLRWRAYNRSIAIWEYRYHA